jgi:hypothetical protein
VHDPVCVPATVLAFPLCLRALGLAASQLQIVDLAFRSSDLTILPRED